MLSPVYLFVGTLSWPVLKLFRLRARGLENVPAGGFVLAANHLSNLDPWALAVPLFPRRQLRFMAKAELFNPVLAPILRGGGAFKVRRGEVDVDAIKTAVRLVRSGEIVAMFPEGTRRKKGLAKKFQPRPHSGTARIALAADAPLVPAAIAGTDHLTRLGPIHVAYGTPVPLDDLRGGRRSDAARAATERLMDEIARLEASL